MQTALKRRERFEVRYALLRKDGALRRVEDYGQGVYDEEGNVVALEGIVYDVTEAALTEERLEEAEERYHQLVERLPAVVYIEETNGRMGTLYGSPQIETMLGYPQNTYVEDPDYWVKILHPDDRERVLAEDRRAIASGEPLRQEYRVVAGDGRTVWVRDEAVTVKGQNGDPSCLQGFIFDITERKEFEARLTYQALHDPLTRLPNRTLFLDRLEQSLAQIQRRREVTVAVLFMDMDDFKNVNDSLGHEAGDELLRAVGARLTRRLRDGDTAARLGGDEFRDPPGGRKERRGRFQGRAEDHRRPGRALRVKGARDLLHDQHRHLAEHLGARPGRGDASRRRPSHVPGEGEGRLPGLRLGHVREGARTPGPGEGSPARDPAR